MEPAVVFAAGEASSLHAHGYTLGIITS